MKPSFLQTVVKQSMEPLYLTPPPEVIIMRLLTVSMRKDRPRLPLSPTRIGFRVSNKPKYMPRWMKIPTAEMVKPLYRPWIPSDLRVLV